MATDTHEMVLVHRALRRETGRLPDLFRTYSGQPDKSPVIAAHAQEMLDFLHVHHSGEDELLWPVLRPHAADDAELLERMQAHHDEIAAAVADVERELPSWATSADADTGERMAARLEAANAALNSHLDEEEQRILPLAGLYMSPQQWAELGKHGFGSVPPKRRMVILGHILAEANPAEQAAFLKNLPRPVQLLYRVVGKKQYAKDVAKLTTTYR